MKLLLHPPRALRVASRTAVQWTGKEAPHVLSTYSALCLNPLLPQQWRARRTVSNTTTATATATSPDKPTEIQIASHGQQQQQQQQQSLQLTNQVRLLMRRIPYPVAIITSTDPTHPPGPTTSKCAFRGMTVSSFNTVTLTPEPVISFNVRRPSETLNALFASERFLVHLLAPRKETAALARDFSRGNQHLALLNAGEGGSEFEFCSYFSPAPHRTSPAGSASTTTGDDGDGDGGGDGDGSGPLLPLPLLQKKKSTSTSTSKSNRDRPAEPQTGESESEPEFFPFVFECRLHPARVDVHDHTIVVGTVVRALEGSDFSSSPQSGDTSPTDLCLTYANTRFWEMGHEIINN
ncbi:hypothetical protein P175DRAFT_0535346 [Aspergillus ochraceoroseus IBT 24754]|uniref:Flavin reductase like domain-containing protein n=2 Tax=Aspergillus ochraceoroseus TaxID=138278 RepID=A0A2T5LQ68_9EURO|nr:uncharacterized protein P175DRAFT_0535346 [Aspergillus ochraceoroseus IBT 24754]KKK12552.1 hypothetical protein AOCH_005177 [Aspergillus ochraceoroseus]PTU18423.1 hypothetical protein P175DRAFT_0535346 [Aspergillus ochraceoroseus IBT 24754]